MATDEELKRAYKAFKKRLKLARLDDESGLSRGKQAVGNLGDHSAYRLPAGHLGRTGRRGEAQVRGGRDLFPGSGSLKRRASFGTTTADPPGSERCSGWPRLSMLGLSWPLWLEPSRLPRVPFVVGIGTVSPLVSWFRFAALLASIAVFAAGLAWRRAGVLGMTLLDLVWSWKISIVFSPGSISS